MNIRNILNNERYHSAIYLNDRRYTVLDVGEGKCHVILVNDIDSYVNMGDHRRKSRRLIIVDVSNVIDENNMSSESMKHLANDFHLLLDVFWLDEVELKSEVIGLKMDSLHHVIKLRDYSRLLLKQL